MAASKKVWVTLSHQVRFFCTAQNVIMVWHHLAEVGLYFVTTAVCYRHRLGTAEDHGQQYWRDHVD